MKLDTPLPPIFLGAYDICLLEAFSLKEHMTPSRTIGGSYGFQTILSAMKMKTLRLRLDGELHGFVEDGGDVRYQPSFVGAAVQQALPHTVSRFELLEPPRAVTIHHVKTKSALTLLLIDERSGQTISVIGSKIHWNLDGLDVRFETPDGHAVQA